MHFYLLFLTPEPTQQFIPEKVRTFSLKNYIFFRVIYIALLRCAIGCVCVVSVKVQFRLAKGHLSTVVCWFSSVLCTTGVDRN